MQQEEPNKMKPNQKDELEKKTDNEFVRKFAEEKYKYGFTTEVHTDIIERGLNEDVIRLISSKKDEPEWLLEFRLKFLIMPIRRRRKKDRRAWRKSILN